MHAEPERDVAVTVIAAADVEPGDLITEVGTPDGKWYPVLDVDRVARVLTIGIDDGDCVEINLSGPRTYVLVQDQLPLA